MSNQGYVLEKEQRGTRGLATSYGWQGYTRGEFQYQGDLKECEVTKNKPERYNEQLHHLTDYSMLQAMVDAKGGIQMKDIQVDMETISAGGGEQIITEGKQQLL